jgi:hypothetical protein
MFVRSEDDGRTWTDQPQGIYPTGELGQQGPQITTLSSGRILASFFRWQAHSPEERGSLRVPVRENRGCLWSNAGVGVCWSDDNGDTWSGLSRVPSPWWDRGGASRAPAVELDDGRLLLPCYGEPGEESKSVAYLMESADGGTTWKLFTVMADGNQADEPYDCHEPFVLKTAAGKLLCFLRCYGEGGLMRICESEDGGKTWSEPRETAVWGFPQAALELPDGRIVLAYGYRREPYGVRARLLEPDVSNLDSAPEVVVREDGDDRDLGYPTLVAREDGTVLVAYYIHREDGVRHIAGTVLDPG